MDSYTITIAPNDDTGAVTRLVVDTAGDQVRITDVHLHAPAGLSSGHIPAVDFDLLLRAVTGGGAATGDASGAGVAALSAPEIRAIESAAPESVQPAEIVAPARRRRAAAAPAPATRRRRATSAETAPATGRRQAAAAETAPATGRRRAATAETAPATRRRRAATAETAPATRRRRAAAAETAPAAETAGGAAGSRRAARPTTAGAPRGAAKQSLAKAAQQSPAKRSAAKQTPTKLSPAKQTPAKQTPAKQSAAKQTPAKRTAAKKAEPATATGRVYRPAPRDLSAVLDRVKTVAAVAEHYQVPRYTAQGWVGRLRAAAK